MSAGHSCHLFAPDGTLLATGWCSFDGTEQATVQAAALDRPGRLIQRCLLGNAQDVWVHFQDGVLRPARVQRLLFDRAAGRVCELESGQILDSDRQHVRRS